jgi:uncharacterized protein YkwD
MRTSTRWVAALAAALALATPLTGAAYADTAPQPSSSPAPGYSANGTWQLLALVNQHRRSLGLRPLTVDSRLASIARNWTERMAASGNLAHNDALFTAVSHRSLSMRTFGENVGWNVSVPEQNTAFLNSSGHRANIDNPNFRVAGFAVVRGTDGRIWSTEDFGTPSS